MPEDKSNGFSVQDILAEVAAEQAPPADEPVQEPQVTEPAPDAQPDEEPTQEASPPDEANEPVPEPKAAPNPNSNLEQENSQYRQGFQQIQQAIEQYIQNPDLYHQERVKRGLEPAVKPEEPADIEIKVDPNMSTEDFLKEVKRVAVEAIKQDRTRTRSELDTFMREAKSTINSEASKSLQPHYVERWKTAVSDLSSDYGTAFKEVEADIRASILQDPSMADIRSAYTAKRISEKEALNRAFKSKYEDRWLDHKISQRLEKKEAVSKAKTESKATKVTKKSKTQSDPDKPSSGGRSSMTLDILNETNEETNL